MARLPNIIQNNQMIMDYLTDGLNLPSLWKIGGCWLIGTAPLV